MTAIVVDRPSNGARLLAETMGVRRVRPNRVPNTRHRVLINWGVSTPYRTLPLQRVLNDPNAVRASVDKLRAFNLVPEFAPPHWRHREEVVRGPTDIILCRRNGLAGGAGITVIRPGQELVDAEFYVKYLPKIKEARVHVVNEQVVGIQQKMKRNGAEQLPDDRLIRSHDNGWVFVINNTNLTEEERAALSTAAVQCVQRIGLDFAAVDLLIHRDTGNVYFLETNTRPGIESPTIAQGYAEAFNRAEQVRV